MGGNPTSPGVATPRREGDQANTTRAKGDPSARQRALEQRLSALERDLATSQHHLEQLEHGISHDLRAPLRAIDGFARLLETRLGEDLQDDVRESLEKIRDASTRAGGLIDALLQLSRVARTPLQRQVVDLSLLADWVLAELQDAQPDRESTLQVQPGLSVYGDERMLKQLLQAVLHNAWKFSDPGQPVQIAVEGEHADAVLHVRVRDAGSGFDMQYADKLFEPFQCLHAAEAGGGFGLGLAIAQRIVQRHGGRISAQSAPGKGSRFDIHLPTTSETATPEATTPEASNPKPANI